MIILRLKKVLDGLINWSISNYLSKTDKTETWLYAVFSQISTSNYNAYESIVDILTRDEKNSRKLATRLLFDPSRAECPTIHIHLPSEEPMGGNLVGMSSDIESLTENGDDFSYNYRKYFSSNYDIIVTSNNQTEVLLIYELLKFLFIAGSDTLNNNFTKFNYSGKELLYDSTLMPDVFFRAFSVNLDDDVNVPSIISQGSVSGVNFDGYFVGNDVPPLDDYVVVFTVENQGVAIVGAEISINDTILTTDENGSAQIELNRQSYDYTITKTGYFDKNGGVNVKGVIQVINVSVELSRNETHPGGVSGQVQVNIDGEFTGFDSFTFDKDTEELSVNAVLLPDGYVPTRENEVVNKGVIDSLTTNEITESTDKKYVTDGEKTVLSNTSGANTGDQDLSGYLKLDQSSKQTLTSSPIIADLTAGRISYIGADKSIKSSGFIISDEVNKRLGVNVNPNTAFHVGDGNQPSFIFDQFGSNFATFSKNGTTALSLITANNTPSQRPIMLFERSRGTLQTPATVQVNDQLGDLLFAGYSTNGMAYGGGVFAYVDGTPGAGTVPTRVAIVTGSASANRKENVTVKASGLVGINNTNPQEQLEVGGNIKASGSVQVGNNTSLASETLKGAKRYREDANNSYSEECMRVGIATYQWVIITQKTW